MDTGFAFDPASLDRTGICIGVHWIALQIELKPTELHRRLKFHYNFTASLHCKSHTVGFSHWHCVQFIPSDYISRWTRLFSRWITSPLLLTFSRWITVAIDGNDNPLDAALHGTKGHILAGQTEGATGASDSRRRASTDPTGETPPEPEAGCDAQFSGRRPWCWPDTAFYNPHF